MSGTGQLISETGIVPKKSKGQNFLTDGRVADRHISYANIQRTDRVLEVGPGLGILTERLLEQTDDLTCIELDDILADFISKTYGDRLKLIHGDAVKVPFPEFDVFVSNLPYSVSTPIIFKLLDCSFRTAVVMVQKEFADRMVADVGSPDYSRLTVGLFYRADCEVMETVPASRFNPKPKVDSALVRITPRKAPFDVIDEELFFKVTKVAFDHRRKKIGTSLKAAGLVKPGMDVPYLDDRIEHLRPAEIAEIADAISRSGNRRGGGDEGPPGPQILHLLRRPDHDHLRDRHHNQGEPGDLAHHIHPVQPVADIRQRIVRDLRAAVQHPAGGPAVRHPREGCGQVQPDAAVRHLLRLRVLRRPRHDGDVVVRALGVRAQGAFRGRRVLRPRLRRLSAACGRRGHGARRRVRVRPEDEAALGVRQGQVHPRPHPRGRRGRDLPPLPGGPRGRQGGYAHQRGVRRAHRASVPQPFREAHGDPPPIGSEQPTEPNVPTLCFSSAQRTIFNDKTRYEIG